MEKVRMTHPDLPDQPIDVLPLAVDQMKTSGWKPVESPHVHDDGSRQIAAQTPTQQPVTPQQAVKNTSAPKGKDGSDA